MTIRCLNVGGVRLYQFMLGDQRGRMALERDLQGISWKNITEGDEKAAKLSSSFKKAGTAATVTLTAPVVAAGKAVFGVASDYEQANARIAAAFGVSGATVSLSTRPSAS